MYPLFNRVRRVLFLPNRDLWLVLRASIWLAAVDIGLRLFGFQRLLRYVPTAPRSGDGPLHAEVRRRVRRYSRRIENSAHFHIARSHCLHRSLVLHFWLRREGLPSELRIGVRKQDGELRAHAWVELQGMVVNDQRDAVAPFTPLQKGALRWTE